MIVSARAHPEIGTIFSSTARLESNSLKFYPLGRDALLSSLVSLGLNKGDSIIIPAYMCNSTINPLKTYGFILVFIDIEKDLAMSIDELKKVIESNQIKALLIVHYFGLTQNFDKVINLCREFGVKVIEDSSHSFLSQFSQNNDSIKGDAEIFSMRKTLPIVDGGALRIYQSNFNEAEKSDTQCMSIISDLRYLILRILEKIVISLGINIYGQFINNIKTKLRINNINEDSKINIKSCQASWQLRKYLGNEKYMQNAQKIIVNNFNQLSQALCSLGFRMLVEVVEEGVVPQACIVYDDKGGLVEYLRLNGIGAWRWPDEEMPTEVAHNSDKYLNAVFFDEKLVLVPIHQSLNDRHIKYIIKVLSRWKL